MTTKGTLWSDFGLVLSARASSLVTNEAFLIASCMDLFLYPLWMRWCSISFVRCWKRFSAEYIYIYIYIYIMEVGDKLNPQRSYREGFALEGI